MAADLLTTPLHPLLDDWLDMWLPGVRVCVATPVQGGVTHGDAGISLLVHFVVYCAPLGDIVDGAVIGVIGLRARLARVMALLFVIARCHCPVCVGTGDDVSSKRLAKWTVECCDQGIGDGRMGLQDGAHLLAFDAHTTNLHLEVVAAQELVDAVLALSHEVAGLVEGEGRRRELGPLKHLGEVEEGRASLLRVLDVALGQAVASNEQLADLAWLDIHQLARVDLLVLILAGVEGAELAIVQWLADGYHDAATHGLLQDLLVRDAHTRLGGAVEVVNLQALDVVEHLLARGRQQGFPDGQHVAQRVLDQLSL
mmetsp:Transcript_13268/g.34192  ORF Transcript_13268/g.34192 Transcript_13268/m.34192 type:complete len:312 (+) Transcript_13268:1180-2115(+)